MPKKVAPQISDESVNFFESNFRNLNAGVTYIVDAFPGLYDRTMYDIKEIFNREELSLILDVVNGLMLTPNIAGNHLFMEVRDGIELDGLDKKWKVDKEMILKKIALLSIFHVACLEIWAKSFWDGKREGQGYNLDEYVKKLAAVDDND